jgi:hypothetical protein
MMDMFLILKGLSANIFLSFISDYLRSFSNYERMLVLGSISMMKVKAKGCSNVLMRWLSSSRVMEYKNILQAS